MNLNVYVVFDKAVGTYERPQFMRSDAEALRAFFAAVDKEDSPFHMHPEDYAFFRIGTYDDQRGLLRPEEPTCLARAHEYLNSSRSKDDAS